MKHPRPAESTRVIYVSGTEREIGFQHAEQLGASAREGMLKIYYDFWERMLRTVHAPFRWALDPLLVNRILASSPEGVRERIRGIADGLKLPERRLLTSLVLPDLLPILQSYLVRLQPSMFIHHSDLPTFGCSSFVAAGKNFLHGRNLDFPGVAYWDRYPVIQVTERPGRLRYIGFCSAGVPFPGISGVNEAKISVSLHQHYCKETRLKGHPPFLIGEEILGRARTLEEALAIIQEYPLAYSWAFIVTDGKTRRAFVCERHPCATGVRYLEKETALSHSNYFQTPECQPAEYSTSVRMHWDNYWRRARLGSQVETAGAELTAAQAAQFVSEHFDPHWQQEKIINRTVSQVYNIQSYILDTENMKVYLCEGDAPIHLREYREYDLGEIFSGKEGRTQTVYPAYEFKNPKKKQAKEQYILSFIDAFDGNADAAIAGLGKTITLDDNPEVDHVVGLMELRRGNYDVAMGHFMHARSTCETWANQKGCSLPPEYFETCLFIARTYDLVGERLQAEREYERVAGHPELLDSHLRKLARRAKRYRKKDTEKLLMPYSSYVAFY